MSLGAPKKEVFHRGNLYAYTNHQKECGLFQKKTNRGAEDMEFPGVSEIACGISRGELKTKGSWFLALEFPKDLTEFCGIQGFPKSSQGWQGESEILLGVFLLCKGNLIGSNFGDSNLFQR